MDPIFQPVVEAMQAHLPLERMAFSVFHDHEHGFSYLGDKKLAKWFDRITKHSRSRRRIWLDYAYCNGTKPNPAMAEPYEAIEDPHAAILQAKEVLIDLQQGYINIYNIAMKVGDYHGSDLAKACLIDGKVRVPGQDEARKIHGVEPQIRHAEMLEEQIQPMGSQIWHAKEIR